MLTVTDWTAVSLFAGVGGFDLALERNGVRVVAAVEIDDAARGVLADQFPTTVLFTDVKKVTARDLIAAGFDPVRGIITAGFPCQDLSVAGRRKGMGEGTRSGLFWEIVRLLAELRPAWVILENVPGLLSAVCPCPGDGSCNASDEPVDLGFDLFDQPSVVGSVDECPGELHTVPGGACEGGCIAVHGGAMGAVLGALGDLGYGFAYRVLDAQHFGVPQRRRRVIVVGRLGDDRGPVEVLLEPEGSAGDPAPGIATGPDAATGPGGGADDAGIASCLTAREGKGPDSDVTTTLVVADVAPTLRAGGNETGGDRPPGTDVDTAESLVVVETSRLCDGCDVHGAWEHRCHGEPCPCEDCREERRIFGGPDVVNALTSTGVGTCGPDDNQAQAGHLVATTFQKVIRSGARDENGDLPPEVWAERDVAATLNLNDLGSESRACELVVCATGDHTHTLTAEGHDASEDGTGRGTPVVAFSHTAGIDLQPSETVVPTLKKGSDGQAISTETTVRRLTPVECERLQGFPDGHTATSNGKQQADGPRYKQMGNAVAVPVIEWVVSGIRAVEP